jgi:hypothetical protein
VVFASDATMLSKDQVLRDLIFRHMDAYGINNTKTKDRMRLVSKGWCNSIDSKYKNIRALLKQ